ncbi:MAG TPA: hypothetical protein VHP63_01050, partial [candidate division Zixibacteria bacterium]|nr:hypothetical protein [candidate division Zixibacteria bacterium]
SSYFDMLVTGNFESAGFMWNRAALERSSKLGIKYQNVPLKIDCTSPIVQNLGLMKDFLQPPVKRVESLFDGKYQKLFYSAIVQGIPVEHTYFAEFDGKYYWLTYPQDIYAGSWPVKESGYFRVHIHPDLADRCNSFMFETADKFVEQMADSLGISDNDMRHLQASKIDFYFCNSDEMVEQITGKMTRGLYDKASSDIISSFFPHNHEVLHLLIEFKLKDLPLFVHPLFEEGLAVHYGGRWGKSTEALMPLGIYLYEEGLVNLDTLISFKGFRGSAESDIAYPLAALFNRFILEKIGQEKYLNLYRKMSGSFQELSALPPDSVKASILQAVSISSWEEFVKDFNEYLEAYKSSQFAALPGNFGNGKVLLDNGSAVVRNDGDWLEFEFLTAENQSGNLLFGHQKEVPLTYSAMYSEHYGQETAFEGYRYGVRFDVNEAGLYDYATNTLLAKYIAGVNPSPEYYNQESHKINIRIRKSLTNGVVPSETDYKLLNH